jgi:NAD-dependent SIR2 family protein deacetylase
LKKNHAILVVSGSGMLADSGIEPFRGSVGMWKQFPVLKKQALTFESMVHSQMFNFNPTKFWYLFG